MKTKYRSASELQEAWMDLSLDERVRAFKHLHRDEAEDFFFNLSSSEQAELVLHFPPEERRSWLRLLPPDDAADLIQAAPAAEHEKLLALIDEQTRNEVMALLVYAEDQAGGLMNPRYAHVRPDMTVDEAISYLRRRAQETPKMIYYIYVVDEQYRLVGVVTFRRLFAAHPTQKVRDVMQTDLVTVSENTDQESVSQLFAKQDFIAIPVVDQDGKMKGVVTVDDIVDVVREEATEDIHKLGGMEALDAPYFKTGFAEMLKKRGGWLAVLFLGELLTATAMAYFQDEIARAVVLALFVPLIISSGGNSGSQASTLVIRSMALGEMRLRDWWRVISRELATGAVLGSFLGLIGFLRIILWQMVKPIYGEHYMLVALTVFGSLVGVVTFGTLAGATLPFILRKLRFDPASASTPFVATLVDVTGLLIYFTMASFILRGTLL